MSMRANMLCLTIYSKHSIQAYLWTILLASHNFGGHPIGRAHHCGPLCCFRGQLSTEAEIGFIKCCEYTYTYINMKILKDIFIYVCVCACVCRYVCVRQQVWEVKIFTNIARNGGQQSKEDSLSFTSPVIPNRILSLLISRWITALACRNSSACRHWK